jgi:NADP-dependent aldehyde dehydrogenase
MEVAELCESLAKAHSAHPGTSELVGQVICHCVKEGNLPAGVFALLFGSGAQLGMPALSSYPTAVACI